MRFTDGPKIPPVIVVIAFVIAVIAAITVGHIKQNNDDQNVSESVSTPTRTNT